MESTLEMLDGVEEELMERSFLFSDPVSYRDGVGATTQAVREMLASLRPVVMNEQKPKGDSR